MLEASIDSNISHKEFTPAVSEEQNYLSLKESIRMKYSHLGDGERDKLTEYRKTRIGIDKILKKNEWQFLKLKTKP